MPDLWRKISSQLECIHTGDYRLVGVNSQEMRPAHAPPKFKQESSVSSLISPVR